MLAAPVARAMGRSIGRNIVMSSGPPLGFNPASLFRNGEQGWIYDLFDMSTLFQDAAGTTPVTAVGQPVGLILDKSKGLVMGPELVTNGDFSNGTTGWSKQDNVSWSVVDGVLNATSSGSANSGVYVSFSVVAGLTYSFSGSMANIATVTGYGVRIGASNFGYSGEYGVFLTWSGQAVFRPTVTGTCYIWIGVNFSGLTTTLDNISVRELFGNHRRQSISLNRPTLRQDTNGLYCLEYDGLNDSLSTAPFAWGSDKATVVSGVRKLSDAAAGVLAEFSGSFLDFDGSWYLAAPEDMSIRYSSISRGSSGFDSNQMAVIPAGTAPDTAVITAIHDISGDLSRIRRNGVAGVDGPGDKGTGNFGTHPVFFGARAGTSLFFNGWEYSQFAINRLLTANELSQIELYTAQRTGVTL